MNFIGIDIGTTSIKTAAFDETLKCLHSATADYTLDTHGDIVEFDLENVVEWFFRGLWYFYPQNVSLIK